VHTIKVREFAYAPLGRWSGVTFRGGSAVYFEAYKRPSSLPRSL
jgi:hypothetical protein